MLENATKQIKSCTKCKISCIFYKKIMITQNINELAERLIYEANICKFYTEKL